MKKILTGMAFLVSIASFANEGFVGDYELKSGSSSCESAMSIIKISNGLRFLPTGNIGTMFEEENADNFLNINGMKTTITSRSSSHGTKYVTETLVKFANNTLNLEGTLKEYNFGVRTANTKIKTNLTLKNRTLNYSKILQGSHNFARNCIYAKY